MADKGKKELGRRGEELACGHLQSLGHTVLERNWQCGHLEVDIISRAADGLHFTCRNSKRETPLTPHEGGKKGGIGLANVRKRLNLLFGHDYALRIKDAPGVYTVELVIPLTS